MSSPKHEIKVDKENQIVTYKGRMFDQEYGCVFDLKAGTVTKLDNLDWSEPLEKDAAPKKSPTQEKCPGCTKGIVKLLRGGMGWAKAALNIGQTTPEIAAERQVICESCPSSVYDFGVCRDDWPDKKPGDQGCGCVLALKVLQASEECPHKHWLRHDA